MKDAACQIRARSQICPPRGSCDACELTPGSTGRTEILRRIQSKRRRSATLDAPQGKIVSDSDTSGNSEQLRRVAWDMILMPAAAYSCGHFL